MAKWFAEAIRKTDEKLEGTSSYNLHIFRIEEFKKQIERTGSYTPACTGCKSNKAAIDEVILKIDEAVNVPGKSRREYDRLLSHLARHMMKVHHIYPPHYFRNIYSFFGMAGGFIVGLLLFSLLRSLQLEMFSIALVAGSAAGYLTGIRKDKLIKNNNLINQNNQNEK